MAWRHIYLTIMKDEAHQVIIPDLNCNVTDTITENFGSADSNIGCKSSIQLTRTIAEVDCETGEWKEGVTVSGKLKEGLLSQCNSNNNGNNH